MKYGIFNDSAPAMTPQKGHNIAKKWPENFLSQATKGMQTPFFPCFFPYRPHASTEGNCNILPPHGAHHVA